MMCLFLSALYERKERGVQQVQNAEYGKQEEWQMRSVDNEESFISGRETLKVC